jgi:hypothetical protein
MWDNRDRPERPKHNPRAPDYKCRDKSCDGLYWPGAWPPKTPGMKAAGAPGKKEHDAIKRADRKFPQNFPAKSHRGMRVGDATREQRGAALTAAREGGSQVWVDLLNDELDERNLRAQEALPLERSNQVDMPAGGKIEGALEPNAMPAALADGDDDLPF